MPKSNETIEECLENINRRLQQNAVEHKEIIEAFKEKAGKKVDKEMYELYLRSQTNRIKEIDAKIDRAWDELLVQKSKDEKIERDVKEFGKIRKYYNLLAAASIGVMITIGLIAISIITFVYDVLKDKMIR